METTMKHALATFFLMVLMIASASAQNSFWQGLGVSPEEIKCIKQVRGGKVAYDKAGSTNWAEANIIKLCKGTKNAEVTLVCFKDKIRFGAGWSEAIDRCNARAERQCVYNFAPFVARVDWYFPEQVIVEPMIFDSPNNRAIPNPNGPTLRIAWNKAANIVDSKGNKKFSQMAPWFTEQIASTPFGDIRKTESCITPPEDRLKMTALVYCDGCSFAKDFLTAAADSALGYVLPGGIAGNAAQEFFFGLGGTATTLSGGLYLVDGAQPELAYKNIDIQNRNGNELIYIGSPIKGEVRMCGGNPCVVEKSGDEKPTATTKVPTESGRGFRVIEGSHKLPAGAHCEQGQDRLCENDACGLPYAGAPDHAYVCCPSGKVCTYGLDYCCPMVSGTRCWKDSMCASGSCKGNAYGMQKGVCE